MRLLYYSNMCLFVWPSITCSKMFIKIHTSFYFKKNKFSWKSDKICLKTIPIQTNTCCDFCHENKHFYHSGKFQWFAKFELSITSIKLCKKSFLDSRFFIVIIGVRKCLENQMCLGIKTVVFNIYCYYVMCVIRILEL